MAFFVGIFAIIMICCLVYVSVWSKREDETDSETVEIVETSSDTEEESKPETDLEKIKAVVEALGYETDIKKWDAEIGIEMIVRDEEAICCIIYFELDETFACIDW